MKKISTLYRFTWSSFTNSTRHNDNNVNVSLRTCALCVIVATPIFLIILEVHSLAQSKEDGKDLDSIQSSTTPDPGHHMGK